MNTNEPREPISTEGGQFGDEDHVEVLVEDLFIEDYQTPLTLPSDRPMMKKQGRLRRAVQPIRNNASSVIGGLLAIGGLALAMIFLADRRRKVKRSALARLFAKLDVRKLREAR